MTWNDIPRNPTSRMLRQFAAAWIVFFSAYGIYQYAAKGRHELGAVLVGLAVVVGVVGLIRPALVRWIFVGWMILAFPIGWLLSRVALLLMFYGILTPLAVLFRMRGRDMLLRKRSSGGTFWLPKEMPKDVRSYFRQY